MNTETIEEPSVLSEVQALSLPDMAVMTRSASSALRMAQTFVISTDDDYSMAAEELKSVKGKINRMEAMRTSITGPMNKALKAVNDLFRGPAETLAGTESAWKTTMLAYDDAKARQAAEERRIAEAAAAAERARIAEAARRVELAAAAERKIIADKAAAVAAAARAEQDQLARVAAEAAAAGNKAAQEEANRAAEASKQAALLEAQQANERDVEIQTRASESSAALVMESAVVTAAQVTPISQAKGISSKSTFEFEVTSMISLVKHIAANPALINLVMADSVKLRAYVRGLGENTELPGVCVFQKRTMSARAA